MKKFVALLTKEKTLRKWIGKLWPWLSSSFIQSTLKKLGQVFFDTYLLTFVSKDILFQLKVKNIWTKLKYRWS